MLDEDRIRIGPMIDACEDVIRFMAGRQREDLDDDVMLRLAVVRAIEIIGEAATHVSFETRRAMARVPWAQIMGMRNRLIHACFDINTDRVWETCVEDIPTLLPILKGLLEATGD